MEKSLLLSFIGVSNLRKAVNLTYTPVLEFQFVMPAEITLRDAETTLYSSLLIARFAKLCSLEDYQKAFYRNLNTGLTHC